MNLSELRSHTSLIKDLYERLLKLEKKTTGHTGYNLSDFFKKLYNYDSPESLRRLTETGHELLWIVHNRPVKYVEGVVVNEIKDVDRGFLRYKTKLLTILSAYLKALNDATNTSGPTES